MSRTSTFLAVLAAALVVAIPVGAAEGLSTVTRSAQSQQASGPASAGPTAWYTALRLRSEGLNRTYGLGSPVRAQTAGEPVWLRALRLRSEGLNRA